MDRSYPTDMMYLAPGADTTSHALQLPGAMQRAEFPVVPAVDDRAVEPETGTEMIQGKLRKALPAEPPHADRQCDIAYVIRSDVAPGYVASTELLTRVERASDFATDACIRKVGRDPGTGSRYLEEISFEVKHKQSNADITARARQLIRGGVRRVFAIHVREDEQGAFKAGPVREWLASEDCWLELHPEAEIVDRCLVQPVKVQALIDATEADNQVARALLAQNNPVLVEDRRKAVEARDAEHARTLARTLKRTLEARDAEHARTLERTLEARDAEHARQAILDLCDVLAVEITTERRARMEPMTSKELDALRSAIRTQRRWPEDR
jgi:hypothetical protein